MINNYIKNQDLLDLAFTHRSWLNEHSDVKQSNERLEFLGDAVLEFIVSGFLFNRYPNQEEGFLTALRAKLVNTENLARVGGVLDLGQFLKLSKGEEETGGRTNESLLANTVEAVIGAIYLDSGIEEAQKFVESHILIYTDEFEVKPLKDYKSRLQEAVQARGMNAPKYIVVSETGLDHNKTFEIQVVVDNIKYETGKGKSKALAAQDAARKSLDHLQ